MQAGRCASDIESFVAVLRGINARELNDDELAERCLAASVLVDVVQAHAAELAAEFEQRGTWADDGASSATAWIASRTRQLRGEVSCRVKVGSALRDLPGVAAAARQGQVTFDHVRRIVDCASRTPDFGADEEALLLEHAATFDAAHFRVLAREWCNKAEDTTDDGDAPVEERERREFVHFSQTFDGWWRLDGEFGPENGALVESLLREYVDKALRAQRDGDPSLEKLPISGLQAEALVDLVAQHQRRGPKDKSVADRYRVAVVIRPDECPLQACDSDLYRLVMTAEGEVLDIGRLTREWTPPIRRAVVNRDGGCVFPGCDRPPSWCEIHHCWEWEHGGPTCQDNGALLCRRHHSFIHRKKWRVVIDKPGGKPQVLKPDGTPFDITEYRMCLA